ncbi:hypothetical protein DPMN_036827 [Dreissena polymorpha]|uniref:Uncharacterized protein n=1 Tax=Dreissena polymorpha TaxID=45954 RepID=A0A9D4MCA4_DREPO|nr:hypothetical protein DPMN_036827 [Dreissena polymorpha]
MIPSGQQSIKQLACNSLDFVVCLNNFDKLYKVDTFSMQGVLNKQIFDSVIRISVCTLPLLKTYEPSQKPSYAMCGKRYSKCACTLAQSSKELHCPPLSLTMFRSLNCRQGSS